jgi:hypothetical protein
MEPRNRFQGNDSASLCPGGPVQQPYLLYLLARLQKLPESIPGLLKRLQIGAQTTLDSGIGSLESIPRLHNVKNDDEDDFFWIKTNIFVPQLSKGRRMTNLFIPKLSQE